ncbi:hypothetical protein E4631_22280 [Hymenobacter sp. UV11]|uniref:type VI secretion system baseplate subunit TssK n=1 Tax=Hymenobacter sp. UV11 TaxID=1849735 RepID=UPI00105F1AD4|nr:type VI secretion system baseplate subunit TssK [Hymenobacter sp. UV11]TDN38650.1 hypothetical protein A8B98_22710 [Hymenobacter sp. UV11]TFZ63564.1 hypothetical protein E4631_22280 [Hymenobacter sp. UV11]
MLIPRKYFAVNWVHGMKLTERHLLDADLHLQDMVRDALSLSLTSYNFGLLPPFPGAGSSLDISLEQEPGGVLLVRVQRCNAVTAGGCRISIDAESAARSGHVLTQKLHVQEEGAVPDEAASSTALTYHVVLRVNPFQQVAIGVPDLEESPLRHPYTEARYELFVARASDPGQAAGAGSLVPEQLGGFELVVGRVQQQGGQYQIDETFIPPSASMMSHPRLVYYHKRFEHMLDKLRNDSLALVAAIRQGQQTWPLARNIEFMSIKLLEYLGQVLFNFRNQDRYQPPVTMLDHFNNLASLLQTSLYCLVGSEKQAVLDYFSDLTEFAYQSQYGHLADQVSTPKRVGALELEAMLEQLVALDYNHQEISKSMELADRFLVVLSTIWDRLNKADSVGRPVNMPFLVQQLPGDPDEASTSGGIISLLFGRK